MDAVSLRGLDTLANDKKKVMERLEWLNYLRLIYNLTAGDTAVRTSNSQVRVEAFLNALLETVPDLPLMAEEEYRRSTTVKCFSLSEVFEKIEAELGNSISWDMMLVKLFEQEERATSPADSAHGLDLNGTCDAELLQITKHSNSLIEGSEELELVSRGSRVKSNLHIPQTPPSGLSQEFLDYVEPQDSVTLDLALREDYAAVLHAQESVHVRTRQHLSLARTGLSALPQLSEALVVLNLAGNSLSTLNLPAMPLLRFLNISYNRLTTLSMSANLGRLEEALVAHNSVQRLGSIDLITLRLLDLAHNLLSSVPALGPLTEVLSLRVLRLDGNPLQDRAGFERDVRLLLPQVERLRVSSIRHCSAFTYLEELPFFPLEEEGSPHARRITSDPGTFRDEPRSEGRRASQPFTLRS